MNFQVAFQSKYWRNTFKNVTRFFGGRDFFMNWIFKKSKNCEKNSEFCHCCSYLYSLKMIKVKMKMHNEDTSQCRSHPLTCVYCPYYIFLFWLLLLQTNNLSWIIVLTQYMWSFWSRQSEIFDRISCTFI